MIASRRKYAISVRPLLIAGSSHRKIIAVAEKRHSPILRAGNSRCRRENAGRCRPLPCPGYKGGTPINLQICRCGFNPGVRREIRRTCSAPAERQANAVAWPHFPCNTTGYKTWLPARRNPCGCSPVRQGLIVVLQAKNKHRRASCGNNALRGPPALDFDNRNYEILGQFIRCSR